MSPTDATPPVRPPPVDVPRHDGGRLGAAITWVTLALLLALLAGTAMGRTIRAPVAPLAAVVTFLPYLFVGVASWAFAAWCAFPDRRALPAMLAATLAAAGGLWGPSWSARSEHVAGDDLTVLSWNLRRLWGGTDPDVDPLQCAVDAIRGAEPDVLTLTELSQDDVDRLSAALDLTCFHVDYLGTGDRTRGGLAVCTRGARWRLVSGDAWRFTDGDDWRYVFGEIAGERRVINVLGVHLHPYWPITHGDVRDGVLGLAKGEAEPLLQVGRSGEQVVRRQGGQSAALVERVSRFADPTLVGGDFNSTPDGSLHTELRRRLVDTWARGGRGFGGTVRLFGWVPLRIDFVYATPTFAVRSAQILEAPCSDHRALRTELTLRAAP